MSYVPKEVSLSALSSLSFKETGALSLSWNLNGYRCPCYGDRLKGFRTCPLHATSLHILPRTFPKPPQDVLMMPGSI